MYRQNNRFSPMKDRKQGMKNSSGMSKGGINVGGNYRSSSNLGRGSFGSQQSFSIKDVSKLKQLCTVTNEWIQQKSSEILDVLKHSDNNSGDNCRRTVTLQSRMGRMNYDSKPPSLFDRKFERDDFHRNRNSLETSNFGHVPPNQSHSANIQSHSANIQYDRERERHNQPIRDWGSGATDMGMNPGGRTPGNSRSYNVLEKVKMYIKDKQFNEFNAKKILAEAVQVAKSSYSIEYDQINNMHRFNLIVENISVGVGSSVVKKKAKLEAYTGALKRLYMCSIPELIETGAVAKKEPPAKLSHQADIERDLKRPISSLVIIEMETTANRREKNAMSILRRSVYSSKMDLNKQVSTVGDVHKVTILVQDKPVGIGLGSSMTKASVNAAADALFNNFYRNNPIIQTRHEGYSNIWINWDKIKFLAGEMEKIGGHSLISRQDVPNRCFATAIQKLVDTHPWSEVNNELIFGPGMSPDCVKILFSIAKERNLSFEEKQHQLRGSFYILQRYYDPITIVRYLERNGGRKGRYRIVSKSEIPQIRSDHWEPTSGVWKEEQKNVPRMGESNRNFDNSSNFAGRSANNGTFNDMSNMQRKNEDFNVNPPNSESRYSLPNSNNGRSDQRFPQDQGNSGFNDGEFRQMSRSDNEFRQMSDSFDREPRQMSRSDDWGFGQNRQLDDRGFGQNYQSNNMGFGQDRQSDNRGFVQSQQSNDRGFVQNQQSNDGGFGQNRQSDNMGFMQNRQSDDQGFMQNRQNVDRGFGQMRQSDDMGSMQNRHSDDRGFNQMNRRENEEFGQRSGMNFEDSNRNTWNDRGGEFNRTSDSLEFRRMNNPEEQGRGMFDNFDRGQNNTLGRDEKRFDSNYGHTGRDLNQMSARNEREVNSLSQFNDRDRVRSQLSDGNMGRSDIGLHHSSNYDRRFNEQVPNPDNNRNFDQLLQQNNNNRGYDHVSRDDNRLHSQGPNYDDRRLGGFNNDQMSRMNQANSMDSNRMPNNAVSMQNQRGNVRRMGDANSPRVIPPANNNMMPQGRQNQMPQGRQNQMPQGQVNQANMIVQNLMKQNMMNMNQTANKSQLTQLQFLTKKIAHTALHANVKSILANARRLSSIAKARSMMETPGSNKAPLTVRRRGGVRQARTNEGVRQARTNETNKNQKRTVQGNRPKSGPAILRVSQNSKVIKKASGKQTPASTKSADSKAASSQGRRNAKNVQPPPKRGNTVKK